MGTLIQYVTVDSWRLVSCLTVIIATVYYIKQFILHPLSPYPGPLLARCTNLYAAYHGWRGSIHTDMHRCHQKYGPVVRYGPNRLLIDTNTAARDIYGHNANNIKSKCYHALVHGAANTLTLRCKQEHSWRRRILSLALSDATVAHHQNTFQRHIQVLCVKLREEAESKSQLGTLEHHPPLDMSQQCDYLSFDIMSEAIFGIKHSSLTELKYRFVSKALEKSNIRMSTMFQAPFLKSGRLDKYLFPTAIQGRNEFLGFLNSLLRKRSGLSDDGSVFSFLEAAKDPNGGSQALNESQVRAESATLIVAGSDTTSTCLAATLFYLSRNPEAYSCLVEEVTKKFHSADQIVTGPLLGSCVYLRACIDEALRMSPPAGSALWREVGPGGMVVDSVHIPEGVDVGVCIYSLHHSDKYHYEPFRYSPERWFIGGGTTEGDHGRCRTMQDVQLSRSAFMPFSRGPRSCVGKGFAYCQLTLALAHIVYSLDFCHADDRSYRSWSQGCDNSRKGEEFLLQDHITGSKSGPFLRFRLRDESRCEAD